jgi:hypothetical protein
MTDDMTLEQLREQADKQQNRRRNLYRYAKSKGFTSREATVLSNRTEAQIDKLADEKARNEGGNK